ncbi:DUF3078 domain-containing protein [Chryseobacterium sp.]|nr:DUF3078 domain-containing protein [Chryseobacterium sp.]
MKRLFTFLLIVSVIQIFSQETKTPQQIIDSVNQEQWNAVALDLDSLADPEFFDFETHFKDTIVIRDKVVIPVITQDFPLTPFNLMNQKEEQKWYFYGLNNLVINQASYSNWNAGGNDNFGINGKINYNLSYKNGKHFLENILQSGYGLIATTGQSNRKTEDNISLMSNYGYDLGKDYYLSTGFQFTTQYTAGYNYALTPDPVFADRISKFMAPGYLNAGLGVSYNPEENFQLIFRPLNGKFTFVTDPLLQKAGRYGLERDGQSVRSELGAMVNVIYRLKIYKGITFDNQLNFFSNYLFHTERVDVAYSGTLNIRFNRFISTVVSLDMMYDHDQLQKLQRKQTLGIGFSYSLGQQKVEKDSRKKVIKPFIVQ